MNYRPTAESLMEIVDCRMMQLELEFFLLSKTKLIEFAYFCAQHTNMIFSNDFFCQWDWQGRNTNYETLLSRISQSDESFDFDCSADVLSSLVYNRKSYSNYDKLLFSPSSSLSWKGSKVSCDYSEVFNSYLPDFGNPATCKEAIFNFFNEPGRKKMALWRNHDVSMSFFSHKYTSTNDLYFGTFKIKIAFHSLIFPSEFSKKMVDLAVSSTSISPNINARIALSPIESPSPCSAHMLYFGGQVDGDGSHISAGIQPQEWYSNYYFRGAEWFNLLSPLISLRLQDLRKIESRCKDVIVEKVSNGATVVRAVKEIDKTDVMELRQIRSILYPVLYPGRFKIRFEHLCNSSLLSPLVKPRLQWECIPIFRNEIYADESAIHFIYRKDCDIGIA